MEFALTGAIFIGGVIILFDIALITFAETLIGRSVIAASRASQIGDFGSSGNGADQFRQLVCDETLGLFDCDDLHISIRTRSSFASASSMVAQNPSVQYSQPESFDFGGPEEIVIFRVMYPWSTLIIDPRLAGRIRNGDNSLLIATAVVQNEPAL